MFLLLSTAALGGPAAEAQALQKPHVAMYHKESTGDAVLTVTYLGPKEAMLRAENDDGVYLFSADATHLRMAVDDVCASLDFGAIHTAAQAVSLGLDTESAQPQLIYRTTDDENIDVSASYSHAEEPMMFSWHVDLEAEDVVLSRDRKSWKARLGDASWTVDAKTGVLRRMTVGDDALVLGEVLTGKRAVKGVSARDACPTTTSPDLEHALATMFRTYSILGPYSTLVNHWGDLSPAKRAEATAAMKSWWTHTLAEDFGPWVNDWLTLREAALREQITDPAAFASVREQYPDEALETLVESYKAHWFAEASRPILQQYVEKTMGELGSKLDEVEAFDDHAVREPLLLVPLQQALLETGGPAVDRALAPILTDAGAALERFLTK